MMVITLPLAALTLMLWIIWSDSVRPRRPPLVIYWFRVALFLAASGVLIYNMIRWWPVISWGSGTLYVVASLAGVVGAIYFFRRAVAASTLNRLGPRR